MRFIICLICLSAFFSCHEEIDTVEPNPGETAPPIVYDITTIKGKVTTRIGNPLNGVSISIGDQTTQSDFEGKFEIVEAKVAPNGSILTLEKEAMLSNYTFIYPNKQDGYYLEVNLISEGPIFEFNNEMGGLVEANNGAQLEFPENAVCHQDGSTYLGTVYVNAVSLDPSYQYHQSALPGDGRIQNENSNDIIGLMSFGVIGVELHSETGELLKIQDSKKVKTTIRIPGNLFSRAPASVSMYSFDKLTGQWLEEGQAIKSGSYYTGEVGHFSYWNFGIPLDFIQLKFRLVDKEGTPVKNTSFNLRADQTFSTTCKEYSNNNGMVHTYVPKGLFIDIEDACEANGIFIPLGTFNEHTDLEDVNIFDAYQTQVITGKVIDCDGFPIPKATVLLRNYQTNIEVVANNLGVFTYKSTLCRLNHAITALARDNQSLLHSQPTEVQFDMPVNADMGEIKICNDKEEYFTFSHKCSESDQGTFLWNGPMTITGRREEFDPKHGLIYLTVEADNFGKKLDLKIEYSKVFDSYRFANYFNLLTIHVDDKPLENCFNLHPISQGFAGWGEIQYVQFYINQDDDDGNPNLQIDTHGFIYLD